MHQGEAVPKSTGKQRYPSYQRPCPVRMTSMRMAVNFEQNRYCHGPFCAVYAMHDARECRVVVKWSARLLVDSKTPCDAQQVQPAVKTMTHGIQELTGLIRIEPSALTYTSVCPSAPQTPSQHPFRSPRATALDTMFSVV